MPSIAKLGLYMKFGTPHRQRPTEVIPGISTAAQSLLTLNASRDVTHLERERFQVDALGHAMARHLQPYPEETEEEVAQAAAATEYSREKDDLIPIWQATSSQHGIVLRDTRRSRFDVRFGTLNKLVELLTTTPHAEEKESHFAFIHTFLITFRSFCTPELLLTKLEERFWVPSALVQKAADPEKAAEEALCIRRMTCNVLRLWFTQCFDDFYTALTEKLKQFIVSLLDFAQSLPTTEKLFITIHFLDKAVQNKAQLGSYDSMFSSDKLISNPPPPNLPPSNANWSQLTFMDMDTTELARQLTIMDFHSYADLKPIELMSWCKPQLQSLAPNVLALVNRFNLVSGFTATLIVTTPRLKDRIRVLQKLIDLALVLCSFNNFNSLMAMLSGFSCSAVGRLRHSFNGLSSRHTQLLADMRQIMSNSRSYAVYRQMFNQIKPPGIPFVGVYLSDLVFIEDGNPDDVNGMINFYKRSLVRTVIESIVQYQKSAPNFLLVPRVQGFINKLPRQSEEKLFELSLLIEPRGVGKKGIA